jgi:superfamily II DNA/RNA helicase
MLFAELNLHPKLLEAIVQAGYTETTTVQEQSIPLGMAGHDLMVSAATGSGKTAAFLLPVLQKMLLLQDSNPDIYGPGSKTLGETASRGNDGARENTRSGRDGRPVRGAFGRGGAPVNPNRPQASVLVLCPTRELAQQVADSAVKYGRAIAGFKVATVVGGVPYGAQLAQLKARPNIIVATPGRLIDHLQSKSVDLSAVSTLVLDEADRMLDMGFIEDIEHIAAALTKDRQTVMFSATFAGNVGSLAQKLTRDAKRIDVASHTDKHDNITQVLHWADNAQHKYDLLNQILCRVELEQAVVFTSTQRDADWLADKLFDAGHGAAALHGGMPQGRRTRVLNGLRKGELRILIATDVAARGIDVPTISHVVNFGLPMTAEDYVHRIGRTGRAGKTGTALTLAVADEAHKIRAIQRFTTQQIPVDMIVGLEPKKPAPSLDKPMGGGRGKGFGDFGARSGRGGNQRDGRKYGAQHNDSRNSGGYNGGASREGRSFGGDNRNGGGYGGDRGNNSGGYQGNRDSRSAYAPRNEGGFGGNSGGGYEQRAPRQDASRQGASFAPANRFQTAGSFAPAAPRQNAGFGGDSRGGQSTSRDGLDGRANRFAKRG